ncbi:MAG: M1 family metallopeptidase [Bacteroidetes bacterium]|nr:M1 family metallopeptidase [Bacteroidota bacterium]
MNKFLLLFFLLVIRSLSAQTQDMVCYYNDPGKHERNRNVDVTNMKLEVSFKPEAGMVTGKVTHTFSCLQSNIDTIFLDGPAIVIQNAWLDGKSISTRKNANGIICETGLKNAYQTTHTLVLEYTATPKRGIYFIGWNVAGVDDPVHQTRKQIWTQGQGIDNRHWIPMIDDRGDKFVTEVFVQFQKEYNVLSNGNLIAKKDNKDGTLTWNYKINHQHAGYLLMLAIDKYAVKSTRTKRGTPIHFWYYPEHPEKLEPSSMYSERIIEFLEDEIGVAYPWGSYSQVMVQDFLYGAMENTSATTFGDFFWVDSRGFLDRNYIGVNAHEATHQWFGDLITARNDADHWLQESFATFYPGLFTGSVYGADETPWYFRGNMNGALAAGEKNSLPVRNSEGGTARHYPKGASVLYMLQHVMGRENFRRGVQLYLKEHGFSGVETRDFELAMIDASGMNMDWFFDQWIYRGGEPNYKVSWQALDDATEVSVEQIHKMENTVGLFKMPVDFAIYYADGSIERRTVVIDKISHKIKFQNTSNKKVDFVLFDEGSFILKKLTYDKSLEGWMKQYQKAEFMMDRYDAIVAIGKFPIEKRREFLRRAFETETNKNILTEIAKQLAKDSDTDIAWCNRIYSSKYVEVRRVFIQNLPAGLSTIPIFENALKDSSYQIIETALLKIWDIYPGSKNALLDQIKFLEGQAMALRVRYLELGTEIFPDMKAQFIGQLTNLCGAKYEFRTRINAMQALQRMNLLNENIAANLFDALLNFNTRLNAPAKDVVDYFKQQTAYARILRKQLDSPVYDAVSKARLAEILGF